MLNVRLEIDDSEGNAKRVMLFGTALLTVIDILLEKDLFKSDNSEIRNIPMILGQFLNFVYDMKEMCTANEDGWKRIVLEKADTYDIKPFVISLGHVIDEIRKGGDDTVSDDESGSRIPDIISRRNGHENAAKRYESKPWVGVITLESLKAGVRRSWTHFDWATEVWPALPTLRFHIVSADTSTAPRVLQSPECQGRAVRTHVCKEDCWQVL